MHKPISASQFAMKACLVLLALVLASLNTVSGQQPAQPVPLPQVQPAQAQAIPLGAPRPRLIRPPGTSGPQEEAVDLTRNYRLTFTIKTSDKAGKEVALLTASSQIRLTTVMEGDANGLGSINAEVSGTLTEKEDGRLRLSYNISTGIALMTQGNTQYINENASGVLVIEPGKSYEIFKSSTRSYSVRVSPEDEGKEKQK